MGVWVIAAVAGLAAAGQGHAQFGFSGGNGRTSRVSASAGNIGPNAHVGSPFRLGDLFYNINPFSNRNTVGRSNIPDPNSPEYLKLFGYKRLY